MREEALHPGWVQRPASLHRQLPQAEGLQIHRPRRLNKVILVAAEEEHERAPEEHDGRQQVRQPEADVALGVDHADLAREGASVDHQVEVQVDARDGGGGIDDDALAGLQGLNVGSILAVLLGDQGGDVGLETTRAHAHDDQTNGETRDRPAGVRDDAGNGRDDQDAVTDESDADREHDGAESAPVLVGHEGTRQGHDVCPEGIDCDS